MNIFKKRNKNLLICIILVLIYCSCDNKKSYLRDAIKNDVMVCPLICTEDSAIILIGVMSSQILTEIHHYSKATDAEVSLYDAIVGNVPVWVSREFYQEHSRDKIYADSLVSTIYQRQGITGLLDKYFMKNGMYILRSSEQLFPVNEVIKEFSFGDKHNVEYIAYLLSKHNIFLDYVWIDEDSILVLKILEEYSDMSQVL